jgi:hypothetical protein
MPGAYIYKALVGWCTTDETTTPFNIEEFTQIDDEYIWSLPQYVLKDGSSGTAAAILMTTGGYLPYAVVPPNITGVIKAKVLGDGGNVNYFHPVTFSSTANVYAEIMGWMSGSGPGFLILPLIESQTFYYAVGAANSDIWISGFTLKR